MKLTLPPMRLHTLNCAHQKIRLLVDILVHFTSIRTDQACDICMVHELAFRVFEVAFEHEPDAAEELLLRFGGRVVGGAWHCRGWRVKLDGVKLCLDERMLLVGGSRKVEEVRSCRCRLVERKRSRSRIAVRSYAVSWLK